MQPKPQAPFKKDGFGASHFGILFFKRLRCFSIFEKGSADKSSPTYLNLLLDAFVRAQSQFPELTRECRCFRQREEIGFDHLAKRFPQHRIAEASVVAPSSSDFPSARYKRCAL